MDMYTGFDIGGTKCAVCIGKETENGIEISDKKVIPTELSVSTYEMIDRMYDAAKSMVDNVDVVGISCGGPLSPEKGVIMSPPNLIGWDNIEVVKYLKKSTE